MNRGSRAVRLARRLRYLTDAIVVMVVAAWGYFLFMDPYGIGPWVLLLGLTEALAIYSLRWASSPRWIDIGPEGVKFQPSLRVVQIPMGAIRDIEAHRHWQSPLARNRSPDYWILIHRSNLRGWILNHVQPAAGERLLYLLHHYQKPILVYNWQ